MKVSLYIFLAYHSGVIEAKNGPGNLAKGWKTRAYTIHAVQYRRPSADKVTRSGRGDKRSRMGIGGTLRRARLMKEDILNDQQQIETIFWKMENVVLRKKGKT